MTASAWGRHVDRRRARCRDSRRWPRRADARAAAAPPICAIWTSSSSNGARIRYRRPRTRSANRRSRSARIISRRRWACARIWTRRTSASSASAFSSAKAAAILRTCPSSACSRVLPTPTWQIDRGTVREFPRRRSSPRTASISATARSCAASISRRTADVTRCASSTPAPQRHSKARWLIDASGRAGLVKRKLGLAASERPRRERDLVPAQRRGSISTNGAPIATWQDRCSPRERWRSTNHLCGPGYWAWLIPLGSGAHSVGIVCDAKMHPLETMNTFDRSLDWFAQAPARDRRANARRGATR